MSRSCSGAQPGLSVVIPAYRSSDTLPELVARLGEVLPLCAKRFEVIVVCDDALEETWNVILGLGRSFDWLVGIRLMRSYGQHPALLCGIRRARYSLVATLDDDLQHPPEELPKLCHELAKGHDVVYGTPGKEQHGLLRNLASRSVKWAMRLTMGVPSAREAGAFRLFRTQLRDAFEEQTGAFVSIDVLLSWATAKFSSVQVEHLPRSQGESGYSNRKLLAHAINMVTGFSALPLRLASLIGFTFTLFGFCSLVWVVGRYLVQGTTVAGFPFIAAIVSIFSGAQLACIGIIGEYLARMHFRSMGRPAYAVAEVVAGGASAEAEQ